MTYPYPELLPQLQMNLDVPSYLHIVHPILYPNQRSRIHVLPRWIPRSLLRGGKRMFPFLGGETKEGVGRIVYRS